MANFKKIVKVSIYSIAGVVVLAAIGVVGVVTLVNPNRFKPMIIKAAYDATGRKLALDGDISWTLYPNLGLKIHQVSLSNPSGFKPDTMLKIGTADVSVALFPLLEHKVIFKNLAIDGLELGLVKQNGSNNWTFTTPETKSEPGATAGKEQPLHIEFSSLSLTNTSISYDDFDDNKHEAIKNANLRIDTGFGGEVRFDSAADILSLSKVSFNYNDSLVGSVNLKVNHFDDPKYSGDFQITKLMANRLINDFSIKLSDYQGIPLLENITFSGSVDGDSKNLKLDNFVFNFNNLVSGKTSLNVTNLKDPIYTGIINLSEFNLNQVLDQAKIAIAARKDKPLLNKFSYTSKFSGNTNSINLSDMSFGVGGILTGTGNIKVNNFSKPNYSGNLSFPEFPLNKVLDGLNIAKSERQNKPLLNSLTFNGKFNGSLTNINLSSFDLNLGKLLRASGNIQVDNFSKPSYVGSINLPQFQLNQVLDGLNIAVPERKNKPLLNSFAFNSKFHGSLDNITLNSYSFKAGGVLEGSGNTFQVNNFSNPKYNGDINLPTFSLNKVVADLGMQPIDVPNRTRLNQVAFKSSLSGSKTSVNLSQLVLKLSTTTVAGSLNIASFKPLVVAENLTIDQLDLSDFSDINGFKVPLRQVQFVGNSTITNSELKTLSGKQSVRIGNVTLLGFSLDEQVKFMDRTISGSNKSNNVVAQIGNAVQINQAINKIKTELAKATGPGPKDLSKKTDLGNFSLDATFQSGIANPSSFKLDGPSLGINGSGSLNLAQKSLNYKVNGKLLVSGINPVFKKLTFPATVVGTFANPSASLGWESIIQQLVAYAVTNGKEQIKNAVNQQINQAVGNQVRQAIGNQGGNKVIDNVSKAAADAIGGLFGGGNN